MLISDTNLITIDKLKRLEPSDKMWITFCVSRTALVHYDLNFAAFGIDQQVFLLNDHRALELSRSSLVVFIDTHFIDIVVVVAQHDCACTNA